MSRSRSGDRVVQRSDVIWFISHGVVGAELENGTLAVLELEGDLLGGPVGVSMRDQTLSSQEQRDFVSVLLEATKAHPTRMSRNDLSG